MNTSLLVYFASISDAVHIFLFVLGFVALMVSAIFSVEKLNHKVAVNALCIPVSILSFVLCAALPSEKDIYKIAGIDGQTKARIDASGEIVRDSVEHKIDTTKIKK